VTAEAGRIGGSLTNAAVGTVSSVVDVAGSAVEAASGAVYMYMYINKCV